MCKIRNDFRLLRRPLIRLQQKPRQQNLGTSLQPYDLHGVYPAWHSSYEAALAGPRLALWHKWRRGQWLCELAEERRWSWLRALPRIDSWTGMLNYMSGKNPRTLRARSANVSIGLGLFPKSDGNLADCADDKYADNHRSIGSRLAANGVGDAEIRLGWEASNALFPWTAVGHPAEQWKACFTNAAKAMKAGSPRAAHLLAHGQEGQDQRQHHLARRRADHQYRHQPLRRRPGPLRHGDGGRQPWGLRAWLAFAKSKGKKLELSEWGVGRRGDNPAYIQNMYDFFRDAGRRARARRLSQRQWARTLLDDRVAKVERAVSQPVLADHRNPHRNVVDSPTSRARSTNWNSQVLRPKGVRISYLSCEARVPADHPLRLIRAIVDGALDGLSAEFERSTRRTAGPRSRRRSCCGRCCCRPSTRSAPSGS